MSTLGTGVETAAAAKNKQLWRPRPLVPTKSVNGVAKAGHPSPRPVTQGAAKPVAPAWPAPVAADISLTSAPNKALALTADGSKTVAAFSAPGLPVTVAPDPTDGGGTSANAAVAAAPSAGSSTPAKVRVTVVDHAISAKAGIPGEIVTVARADGGAGPAHVTVGVDYSSFMNAYGGMFANRLDLVTLPACVLTTPQLPDCQKQTKLKFANTTTTKQLSAKVTVPGVKKPGTAADAAMSPDTTTAGSGLLVLGTATTQQSSSGAYSATSLKGSDTWTASNTGAFSYTYPLLAPPTLGGSAPSLGFSYSSDGVDGKTPLSNPQGSVIGDGWGSGTDAFIEKSFTPCSTIPNAPSTWQNNNEMCLGIPNATLSLPGHSGELVKDDVTGFWRLSDDDGSRLEQLTGATNGNKGDGYAYWRLTTTDGTEYYFGANRLPAGEGGTGTDTPTYSAWGEPVFGTGTACPDPTSTTQDPSQCRSGYRWNLDFVIDPHHNVTRYDYLREENYYKHPANNGLVGYTSGGYLRKIEYGMQVSDVINGAPAASEIGYVLAPRCLESLGSVACPGQVTENSPSPGLVATGLTTGITGNAPTFQDVPSDQVCLSTGSCANTAPSFFETARLSAVYTGVRVQGQAPSVLGTGLDVGYTTVDSYVLQQGFYSPDSATTLELNSVTRVGYTPNANGVLVQKPVDFTYSAMPNRATPSPLYASYGGANAYRMTAVNDELGGDIRITYDTGQTNPAPCGTPLPAVDNNLTLCYPENWTDPGTGVSKLDWFNKYVVTSIQRDDNTALYGAGSSAGSVRTDYTYSSPAWHSNDSEQTPKASRTYDQFRGFTDVTTTIGGQTDPTQNTQTSTRYLRGMDQDPNLAGVGSPVQIGDFHGGTYTDDNSYAGRALETVTFDSAAANHVAVTDVVTAPTPQSSMVTTADHKRIDTLPHQRARFVHTASTVTYQLLSDKVLHKTGEIDYTFDDTLPKFSAPDGTGGNGRMVAKNDLGDGSHGVPQTCTLTFYAKAQPYSAAGAERTALPYRVMTFANPGDKPSGCAGGGIGLPPLPGSTGTPIADVETAYDGLAVGALADPAASTATTDVSPNNVTSSVSAKSFDVNGYPQFVNRARTPSDATGFDVYGRQLQTTDADGSTTWTAYSPLPSAGNYLPTQVTVTTPAPGNGAAQGFSTTTTLDPGRATATEVKDRNGQVTDVDYDGLGRTYNVWSSDHPKAKFPTTPKQQFRYQLAGPASPNPDPAQATPPSWVQTRILGDDAQNPYTSSYQIIDGMGRVVQTQTTPGNDANGQVVTDTSYDFLGRVHLTSSAYYDANHNPSGTWYLYTDNTTFAQTRTDFKLPYPQTVTVTSLNSTVPLWTAATTVQGADRTDVTPPTGGTPTTTVTDALGRITAVMQYKSATPSGAADTTQYTYDLSTFAPGVAGAGQTTTTVTDAAGNRWSTTKDILGRAIRRTDPNSGTSTTSYDDAGRLSSTSDGRGQVLSYSYDAMGRKTGEYNAPWSATPDPSTQLAGWTYDQTPLIDATGASVGNALGQMSSSTRYDRGPAGNTGAAYVSSVNQYDLAYRTLSSSVTVPAGGPDAGLAGTYTTRSHYTANAGLLHAMDLPAVPKANFPADTITNSYNSSGLLMTSSGTTADYLVDTQYTPFGEVSSRTLGDYPYQVVQQTLYDPPTRRVTKSFIDTAAGADPNNPLNLLSSGVDYTTYAYNAAGLITAASDLQNAGTGKITTDQQCYRYDPLGRLKEAWTDNNTLTPPVVTPTGTNFSSGPAPGGIGTCTDTAGNTPDTTNSGPAPYWQTFNAPNDPSGLLATDSTGNRGTVIDHAIGSGTDITHTYGGYGTGSTNTLGGGTSTLGTGPGPHTLGTVTTTGATTGTDAFAYDGAGNTTTRSVSAKAGQAAANQTLTWDAEGRLAKDVDTASNSTATYLYDAAGTQLIRRDTGGPNPGTTLYLGTTEIHYGTGTTPVTTATRYLPYSNAPTTVIGSTGTVSVETTDGQGTGGATINETPGATNQGTITARRYTKPYGETRGSGLPGTYGTFPDDHTFLGKSTDASTGLTDIGARKYDPATGRFISIDPVFQPESPQAIGGYAYADNDAVNKPDPSGECWDWIQDACDVAGGAVDYVAKTGDSLASSFTARVNGLFGMTQAQFQASHGYFGPVTNAPQMPTLSDTVNKVMEDHGFVKDKQLEHDTTNVLNVVAIAFPAAKGVQAARAVDGLMPKVSAFATTFLGGCRFNSFVASTKVLMADGTSKPINEVKVGDEVENAVPGASSDQHHTVTAVIVTDTDRDYTTLTVKSKAGTGSITSTSEHLFYSLTAGTMVPAGDLKPGDRLQTPDGGTATVAAVHSFTQTTRTYSLTVNDVHTYYVEAGDTPVLVHNDGCSDVVLGQRNMGTANLTKKLAAEDPTAGAIDYLEVHPDDWQTPVENAIRDPSVTLHVNMPPGGFVAAAQAGLDAKNANATQQEMSWIARAVANGERSWSTIKFYRPDGKGGWQSIDDEREPNWDTAFTRNIGKNGAPVPARPRPFPEDAVPFDHQNPLPKPRIGRVRAE